MGEYLGYSRELLAEKFDLATDKVIEFNRKLIEKIFGNAKHDFTTVIEKKREKMLVYRVIINELTPKLLRQLKSKENFGLHIESIHTVENKDKLEVEIRIARVFAEYNFNGQPEKYWRSEVREKFRSKLRDKNV